MVCALAHRHSKSSLEVSLNAHALQACVDRYMMHCLLTLSCSSPVGQAHVQCCTKRVSEACSASAHIAQKPSSTPSTHATSLGVSRDLCDLDLKSGRITR
jgi:hypothetical protein